MSVFKGKKINITVFGESHGQFVGAVIDGLPCGERIDLKKLQKFMNRRSANGIFSELSTPRKESDVPEIISGFYNGFTTGTPLALLIRNENHNSKDYEKCADVPRPGHADYSAFLKYNGFADMRGGGHFSGRLTAPICAVGGIVLEILERQGINITSHISSIGSVLDRSYLDFEMNMLTDVISSLKKSDIPLIDEDIFPKMKSIILDAKSKDDSVGGSVETIITGFPKGLGDTLFGSIESKISEVIFAIPAVRGIEFGSGFRSSKMYGSENNDEFFSDGENIFTKTNNHGGILGGISTGMPIIFNCAIKPTPSISTPQNSVNMKTFEEMKMIISGRHDPSIVLRSVPCFEAVSAFVILDMII